MPLPDDSVVLEVTSRGPGLLTWRSMRIPMMAAIPIDDFRRRYKKGMYQVRIRHYNGASSDVVTRLRSALVDEILRKAADSLSYQSTSSHLQQEAISSPLAWLALGEYGWQELSPFSTVELLLLGKSGKGIEWDEFRLQIQELVQGIGIECQVQGLSIKECLQKAQADLSLCLSLLSARMLLGDPSFFDDLQHRLRSMLFRNQLVFLYDLQHHISDRHERCGQNVYLLESDIESGAGGILDFQSFRILMALMTGRHGPEQLVAQGEISAKEWQQASWARTHLLRVRNSLHLLSGRCHSEVSTLYWGPLARSLGYRKTRNLSAAQCFLRDTLRARRRIYSLLSKYLSKEKDRSDGSSEELQPQYLKLTMNSALAEGEDTPERWMKIFLRSQTQPIMFNDVAKDTLRRGLGHWSSHDLNRPAVHDSFRSVLRNRGRVEPALRALRELGFLGKYLPEFGALDCLPQLDPLLPYSLDELTFRMIAAIDEASNSNNPALQDYRRILEQVVDPSLLYMALLFLHTRQLITPGSSARTTRLAARAFQRQGIELESQEKLLLLIREHQLLGQVSQRRDIDDPLIVQEVSESVETSDNLHMLLLLTFASWRAMGPQDWSEHRSFLLWSLYFKVFDRLMFGDEISEPEHAQVAAIQRQVLEVLEGELSTDAVLRHFLLLPEKYALYTPRNQIPAHIRLCERLGEAAVVTEWVPHPHAEYTELYLSTRDMPGRFAQIAGCLACHGISILSAQLNTRTDGIVIDTFQICDAEGKAVIDKEIWRKLEWVLTQVINGKVGVESLFESSSNRFALEPSARAVVPRIRIDNEISAQSTVIEVQAQDRLSLGYHVARTLAQLGLNIVSAKLATERNHSFNVFYVQDRGGEKITSSFQMTEIMEALRRNLDFDRI